LAKSDFYIERVTKKELEPLLLTYHYLKDESKTFKSHYNYGLFKYPEWECPLNIGGCLGGTVFTSLPVPEIAVGAFGLGRDQQEGLYELSRLCIHPDIQKEEYNITSWFVSKCIKRFRKDANVSAILSYADSSRHDGVIYRACNFKYYGLTQKKSDFYYADGTKHSRGSIKGVDGEWRERTRKHRYLMVFDKNLKVLWKEQKYGTI
jgi:hypothetical protein